jgi:PAS domain S-box-containing protein
VKTGLRQNLRTKKSKAICSYLIPWLMVGILVLTFGLSFTWTFKHLGDVTPLLSFSFICLAGWLWGLRGGLLVALLSIPYIAFLYYVTGAPPPPDDFVGPIVSLALGGLVGRLSDLGKRLARQLEYRRKIEEELRQHQDTLLLKVEERTAEYARANGKLHQEIAARTKIERELNRIINSMSESLIVLEPDERIEMVNPAGCELLGMEKTELAGSFFSDISGYTISEFFTDECSTFGLSRCKTFETFLIKKDGHKVPVILSVSELQDLPSSRKGFVCLATNITDRVEADRELKASLVEKEVLLKEIHHRVKNNMQIMVSLLNLQMKNIQDEEVVKALRLNQNRVQAMALVHEILYGSDSFSRIDFKKYIETLTVNLISSYVSSESIHLNVKVDTLKMLIEQALPCGLIINEVVTNAIKYAFVGTTPAELNVICTRQGSDEIKIEVSDNGVGWPDGFDWREHNGLGMRLISILGEKQLDGTVEFSSNSGVTFSLLFKIKPQESEEENN